MPHRNAKLKLASKLTLSRALLAWYQQHREPHPWRTLWEDQRDPYVVWLSEIMLQQTTIKSVLPVYTQFLQRFPSLESLRFISDDDLKRAVQGLGYYRRFFFFKRGVEQVLTQGHWPKSFIEWKHVPGVGDYTAAALASITLNEAVPSVDGNVIRVISRCFGFSAPVDDPALKTLVFKTAQELIDPEAPGDFNQAMMELGQKYCRPTSPQCEICPVQLHCFAYLSQDPQQFPGEKAKKLSKEAMHVRLHIVRSGKKFALYKRPTSSRILKGTRGFLTMDSAAAAPEKIVGTFSHSITRFAITAEVVLQDIARLDEKADWFEESEVAGQLISSLDLKAWKVLQKQKSSALKSLFAE
jgi:A/G-specific adenine glycosylase